MEFSLVSVHVSILIATLAIVLYSDHEAWLYLRGKKIVLNPYRMRMLHKLVWVGLLGMIGTGIFLFLPMREYLLGEPLFLTKIAFVLTLFVNAIFIGRLMPASFSKSFIELTKSEKAKLIVSGALSSIAWVGAILAALILF